jgi:hypothetical protein
MTKGKGISRIVDAYDVTLLDTSIFGGGLKSRKYYTLALDYRYDSSERWELRHRSLNSQWDRLHSLASLIFDEGAGIYFTEGIYNELENGIHRILMPPHANKEALRMAGEFHRKVNEYNKKLRFFLSCIMENDRVLNLKDNVFYRDYSSKYNSLKDKFKLSDADFDLLISGMAIVQSGKNTAIISNDYGILNAYFKAIYGEGLHPFEFGFFDHFDKRIYNSAEEITLGINVRQLIKGRRIKSKVNM